MKEENQFMQNSHLKEKMQNVRADIYKLFEKNKNKQIKLAFKEDFNTDRVQRMKNFLNKTLEREISKFLNLS